MATKTANKAPKVETFTWEGINKAGERVKGELEAVNSGIVKAELRRQGIISKRIRKKPKPFFAKRKKKKITAGDITVFSRQMATMLASGIPLVQSFDIVARGLDNAGLEKLINDIKADVESGTTLSDALRKHPKYFNELYYNLINAGEQSGSLDVMLDKVATYKEKIESIKGKIKKALFYPTAVMIVAFIVTAALLIFVVPQFESLFKGFGADLPAMTRMVITLSEAFQAYWYFIFGGLGAAGYALFYAKTHSPKVAHTIDKLSLQAPIIGEILKKAAIARYCRTLSITFAAGLPLVDALQSVGGATGNILYKEACEKIKDSVSTGQQMQLAMRMTKLFPNMVIQMVAIGEESGSLEEMLSKAADFYEEEVDNAVDALSSLLEPLIMAILGIIVGGLVIAMYLPIFKLGSVV